MTKFIDLQILIGESHCYLHSKLDDDGNFEAKIQLESTTYLLNLEKIPSEFTPQPTKTLLPNKKVIL